MCLRKRALPRWTASLSGTKQQGTRMPPLVPSTRFCIPTTPSACRSINPACVPNIQRLAVSVRPPSCLPLSETSAQQGTRGRRDGSSKTSKWWRSCHAGWTHRSTRRARMAECSNSPKPWVRRGLIVDGSNIRAVLARAAAVQIQVCLREGEGWAVGSPFLGQLPDWRALEKIG